MNKWIFSLAVAAVGGGLLALPGAANAGMVQVPQNMIAGDYASGVTPVHSSRHSHGYGSGYNNGAAIAGAIIGGLAYNYGRHGYNRRSYGYGNYGYRRGYGNSYRYRPSYGYGYGQGYGGSGYGSYGMYGGYR